MAESEDNVFDRFFSLDRWPLFAVGEKSRNSVEHIKMFHVLHEKNLDESIALYSTDERDLHLLAVSYSSGVVMFDEGPMPGLSIRPEERIIDINQNSYMATIITSYGKCLIWPRKLNVDLHSRGLVSLSEHSQPTLLTATEYVVKLRLSPGGTMIIYQTAARKLFICTVASSNAHVNKFADRLQHHLVRADGVDDFDCTHTMLVVLDRTSGVCQLLELGQFAQAKWKMLRLTEVLNSVNANVLNQLHWMPSIRIQQIACGARHTLLLTSQGDVYGFGDNSHKQLSGNVNDNNNHNNNIINNNIINTTTTITPVRLNKLSKFTSIAAHGHLSVAKAVDKRYLWLWGAICGPSRLVKRVAPFLTNLNRLADVLAFYQGERSMNTGQRSFRLIPSPKEVKLGSNDMTLLLGNQRFPVQRSVIERSTLYRRCRLRQQQQSPNGPADKLVVPISEIMEALVRMQNKNNVDIDLSLYIARKLTKASAGVDFGVHFRRAKQLNLLEVLEDAWRWYDANVVLTVDDICNISIDFSAVDQLWAASFATNQYF